MLALRQIAGGQSTSADWVKSASAPTIFESCSHVDCPNSLFSQDLITFMAKQACVTKNEFYGAKVKPASAGFLFVTFKRRRYCRMAQRARCARRPYNVACGPLAQLVRAEDLIEGT